MSKMEKIHYILRTDEQLAPISQTSLYFPTLSLFEYAQYVCFEVLPDIGSTSEFQRNPHYSFNEMGKLPIWLATCPCTEDDDGDLKRSAMGLF